MLRQVLAGVDLGQLRAKDMEPLRAMTTLRSFLLWWCDQGVGHRSLAPAVITAALRMEARVPSTAHSVDGLDLDHLRVVLAAYPLCTRALVGFHVAVGLPAAELVALRLNAVLLAPRGIHLDMGQSHRELVGSARGAANQLTCSTLIPSPLKQEGSQSLRLQARSLREQGC